jgi:hypothetical protein
MPITYTNRKGVTYTLCQVTTKRGKPRYVFAREPKGELVEQIPDGWTISESVNGIVSLVKDRPAQILPQEVELVEAAVARHPKARNYRVAVKHNRIEVYERIGPGADEVLGILAEFGLGPALGSRVSGRLGRLRADMDRRAQFTPVLRFILDDDEQRSFHAERWCYSGSIDDWIYVGRAGPLDEMVRDWIPRLGTDAFFDVV